MMFMNGWSIEDAADRWKNHPTLGPATVTLRNLRDCADRNSDGWAYWPKPARAAARLMELIQGDGTWEAHHGRRPEVTAAHVQAAYRPVRAFLTRSGLTCTIVDPGQPAPTTLLGQGALFEVGA